jgi:hypothetical protein
MLLFGISAGVFVAHGTSAQRVPAQRVARPTPAVSGFEMALSGTPALTRDRLETLHGTAYRVRGLATLEAFPNARVQARLIDDQEHELDPPVVVSADAQGHFALPLTPHTEEGVATLEVTLRDPRAARDEESDEAAEESDEASESDEQTPEATRPSPTERVFLFQVALSSPRTLDVRMDRVLYEPGEPVHVLARLRDARSQRPIENETISFRITQGVVQSTRAMTTGPSGAVSFDLAVAEDEGSGSVVIQARATDVETSAYASIGRRSLAHLTARVRTEPEEVAPGGAVDVIVTVNTPSGAPVQGAHVSLTLNDAELEGVSDAQGEARIHASAPTGQRRDAQEFGFVALVHHAGHGEVRVPGLMRLAMPLSLSIEAMPRTPGGLVPEVPDSFFLMVTNGFHDPVAAGTEIVVEGPAIRGGRATVRTDVNGLAEVPTFLPAGVWSPSTEDDDLAVTSVLARIHGALELTSRIAVPVQREGDVAPDASSPVVDPGASFEVALRRRPRAQRQPVIVTLIDGSDAILERVFASATANSVRLHAPLDRLGTFMIRARLVKENETAEGAGLTDMILVRPPQPTFVTVRPERAQYFVGDSARLLVEGGVSPAGVRSFGVMVVRDLSAHSGERPFREFFLNRAFEEALYAATPEAHRLLRSALVSTSVDDVPETSAALVDALGQAVEATYPTARTGDFRDPFPAARELERRGLRDAMTAVEEALTAALDEDALDTVTVGAGAARRFRDDLLFETEVRTAGEGVVAVSDLTASDPSFRYETVARRVARGRLVHLYARLARYLDPGDEASIADRIAAREPADRWLPRLIERGVINASDLADPWGGRFALRRVAHPIFSTSQYAANYELASPGPDGRMGTADDLNDPFVRVVPAGTPYALATGEDALMRALARLSAYERTINELTSAYIRTEAEFDEELIGDAVHAGVSEGALGLGNIGTIGHGSGTGSGYGSGGGGFGSRSSSVPRVRAGQASVGPSFDGLSRVLRERFPATLFFEPTFELDALGHASFELRVADAITSYVVETIIWRTDGWVWSAETSFAVEREIVVDAAIPDHARTDDVLAVPVRVSNRGSETRRLRVGILESTSLGLEASEVREVEVAPHDAIALSFAIRPTQVARGDVQIACSGMDGVAVDAIRLPLEVSLRSRRTSRVLTTLGAGTVALDWRIPAEAFDAQASIAYRPIESLPSSSSVLDLAWIGGFTGRPGHGEDGWARARASEGRPALRAAAFWGSEDAPARSGVMLRVAEALDGTDAQGRALSTQFAVASEMLLDLAPVLHSDVVDGREGAIALIGRLRSMVTNGITNAAGNPDALAAAASALAWTNTGEVPDPVAMELVRRVEGARVTVGDDTFVATEGDPLRASAHLALAYLRLGRNDEALRLLTTIVRWHATLADADTTRLTNVGLRLLAMTSPPVANSVYVDLNGAARSITASLDGTPITLSAAEARSTQLATSPEHHLIVAGPNVEVTRIDVALSYRTPWPASPVRGPLELRLEGEVGALDAVTELVLVVRNTTPRIINNAVVDLELPTGAELASRPANLYTQDAEMMGFRIPPLRPGGEARIRLPLRWRVAGTLRGLGLVGYVVGGEDRASVVPPRELTITPREASTGGAR